VYLREYPSEAIGMMPGSKFKAGREYVHYAKRGNVMEAKKLGRIPGGFDGKPLAKFRARSRAEAFDIANEYVMKYAKKDKQEIIFREFQDEDRKIRIGW
jgi:hypothetical protein